MELLVPQIAGGSRLPLNCQVLNADRKRQDHKGTFGHSGVGPCLGQVADMQIKTETCSVG
eukprot:2469072-Amphidinium_carterae.1